MDYTKRASPAARAAVRDTAAERRRKEHNDALATERSREQNAPKQKPKHAVLKLPFRAVKTLHEAISGKKKPKR